MPDSAEASAAVAIAYPEDWISQAVTRDGHPYVIRPLRAEDRAHELAFIASLSEDTRFLRMMHPLKVLPPHLLDQLMDVDYDRRMAFVATIEEQDNERFIAVARYGAVAGSPDAEFGITTADEWQNQGVARLLLTRLFDYARYRGLERIVGVILPENSRMIRLARSLGFKAVHDPDERVIRVTLPLQTAQT
ncbi:MAG TPA: GNAT family N-acetyltransferase [Steroidobacteraceae bacterium]|nr:GNAT family N-acetyltransferase [Steroidobacteraceae bacterium]